MLGVTDRTQQLVLVLAALDRAAGLAAARHNEGHPRCCHRSDTHDVKRFGPVQSAGPAQVAAGLGDHLDSEEFDVPSVAQVKYRLEKLVANSWALRFTSTGYGSRYVVSLQGEEYLNRLMASDELPELPPLPESFRHRFWREQREEALRELGELREEVWEYATILAHMADALTLAEFNELKEAGDCVHLSPQVLRSALAYIEAEEPPWAG